MGYRAHRYRVLFYLLLGTLAAAPLLTALSLGTNLLEMLLAFSLLVAILDAPRTRWRMVLIIAVAVAIALRVAPPSTVHERARSEERRVGDEGSRGWGRRQTECTGNKEGR